MRRFLRQAVLLACVQILLRFLSVSFNAFVSGKVGAEGMGLFTLVMSVYGLSVTVATSGIQLAAIRLSAEATAKPNPAPALRAVMRSCIRYSLFFGTLAGVLLYLFSSGIGAYLLGDTRTVPSLRALALSLPAISLSAALGGYFTGVRRVYKNALLSLTEQFTKIALTTVLLLLLAPAGLTYACLAVVGGSAIAEAVSLVGAFLLYLPERRGGCGDEKVPSARRRVWESAFPVAVGAYARQGLLTAEHLAIPWGLRHSGASASAALAAYGVLHGMVYPVLLFPAAVLSAAASLLVPEFAEYHTRGETARIRRTASRAIETVLFFAATAASVFLTFPDVLGEGIYPGTGAGKYIAWLAPLVPIMYLDSTVDSMLKGLGEQVYCMRVNIIDSLGCLILVLILLPRFGIAGYLAVQYTCEILNATLSIARLLRITGLRPNWFRWVVLPAVSSLFSSSVVRAVSGIPGVPLVGMGGFAVMRILLLLLLQLGAAWLLHRSDTKRPAVSGQRRRFS